jgi:hypothetical protein
MHSFLEIFISDSILNGHFVWIAWEFISLAEFGSVFVKSTVYFLAILVGGIS